MSADPESDLSKWKESQCPRNTFTTGYPPKGTFCLSSERHKRPVCRQMLCKYSFLGVDSSLSGKSILLEMYCSLQRVNYSMFLKDKTWTIAYSINTWILKNLLQSIKNLIVINLQFYCTITPKCCSRFLWMQVRKRTEETYLSHFKQH